MSVRKFNELAAGLPDTVVVCVSNDLPYAQARFCGAEGIDNVITGSGFRSSFGDDYGVTLVDGPMRTLLSRAVVVADEDGTIIHTEQCPNISEEPDYEAVLTSYAEDRPFVKLRERWLSLTKPLDDAGKPAVGVGNAAVLDVEQGVADRQRLRIILGEPPPPAFDLKAPIG